MLVDLQDVGRAVLHLALHHHRGHAGRRGAASPVIVLDRPNPIGGAGAGERARARDSSTTVGQLEIPMRHGMTLGELARLAEARPGSEGRPHRGAGRRLAPSMPTRPDRPAFHPAEPQPSHPGESVPLPGDLPVRGDQPVGGPRDRTRRSSRSARPGWTRPRCWPPCGSGAAGRRVRGRPFTPAKPGDGKYADTLVAGVRLDGDRPRALRSDRDRGPPPGRGAGRPTANGSAGSPAHFDRLAGTASLRAAIDAGTPPAQIVALLAAGAGAVPDRRRPALIYPD